MADVQGRDGVAYGAYGPPPSIVEGADEGEDVDVDGEELDELTMADIELPRHKKIFFAPRLFIDTTHSDDDSASDASLDEPLPSTAAAKVQPSISTNSRVRGFEPASQHLAKSDQLKVSRPTVKEKGMDGALTPPAQQQASPPPKRAAVTTSKTLETPENSPKECQSGAEELQDDPTLAWQKLHKRAASIGIPGLSSLDEDSVAMIQMLTRGMDEDAGHLSSSHSLSCRHAFAQRLQKLEESRTPKEYRCIWDNNLERHYYMNQATGQIEWDMPSK
eukprot:m.72982 g.72982  ORF g.72982 m.72982 type:complete len:276 (+) comp12352_c0_seq2:83-910(+)